jgi:CelD/BcsL family acetyltransferase involved in cellulose biosynthesis
MGSPRGYVVYVRCVENLAELERYRCVWDALADGCVFRTWTWLTTWWRHYGEGSRSRGLRVVLVFRGESAGLESLVGVLPCYVDSSWSQGSVWRLLGDGDVCSDHAGLLAEASVAGEVAELLAAHLADRTDWDLLDLLAVDASDVTTCGLLDALTRHDCTASRLHADRCWAIDLPPTWDEFLAMQSKSHRKQLRQLGSRLLQSPRAYWRLIESVDQFASAWPVLIDLHQRRRRSLGEPGCFASPTWAAFHGDVAQQLLAEDRLRLSLLELDGRPIAAEYHLAGGRTTYAYQGGVDPDRLNDEPGQLSTICCIKRAIAEGHTQFDLLRGDEAYKAHWRATPRQAVRLFAVPPRMWSKVRRGAWNGARDAAHFAKQLTGLLG